MLPKRRNSAKAALKGDNPELENSNASLLSFRAIIILVRLERFKLRREKRADRDEFRVIVGADQCIGYRARVSCSFSEISCLETLPNELKLDKRGFLRPLPRIKFFSFEDAKRFDLLTECFCNLSKRRKITPSRKTNARSCLFEYVLI